MTRAMKSGQSHPLGASWDGGGVNFALFSANGQAVELCLFDPEGKREIARHWLPEKTGDIWHGYLHGVQPGTCYGYRVHGPYEPQAGHRFNHHKLLLDPYAKALKGSFRWDSVGGESCHFGYDPEDPSEDLSFNARDNAPFVPKGIIIPPSPTPSAPFTPRVPWHRTVLYEAHVRGFTMLHPEVPRNLRGTFAGMGQRQVIAYIKALGITSIQLMPVHAFIDEFFLHQRRLTNYWGYNSLSFFVPHQRYLSGAEGNEFRVMVERFHDAGLEVILDVVFNHTCEGDQRGPTLCFRGIDNASYYRLVPGDNRFYINDSGCGNTLNIAHPRVLQLVMDSLRYWAVDMAVDGFRFDLASILGRGENGFSDRASFFQAIAQDPVLSTRKLIAEPWDIGPGGYQLGNFPGAWSELNDRYRDTVRRFWRGDRGMLPELARRLHGSGDIFEPGGRRPHASINFITSHDGFTLRDLVSYGKRHNEANLEDNRDGHRENFSHNHGVEGSSEDPGVETGRWRAQRNFIATLAVSQGIPMILAGDEMGRSQGGNNNAYCQDNGINWIDWEGIPEQGRALQAFTRRVLALRSRFPLLQADRYRHQSDTPGTGSIHWLRGDGSPMLESDWHDESLQAFGYLVMEKSLDQNSTMVLVLFNGGQHGVAFALPSFPASGWHLAIDTTSWGLGPSAEGGMEHEGEAQNQPVHFQAGERLLLEGESVRIFTA